MPQTHLSSCPVPGTTASGTKEACSYGAYTLLGGDREETSKCKGAKRGGRNLSVMRWYSKWSGASHAKIRSRTSKTGRLAELLQMSHAWLDQLVPISLNLHWHLPLKNNSSQLNRYKVNSCKVRQGEYILEVRCQCSAIVTILKNLQFVSSYVLTHNTYTQEIKILYQNGKAKFVTDAWRSSCLNGKLS